MRAMTPMEKLQFESGGITGPRPQPQLVQGKPPGLGELPISLLGIPISPEGAKQVVSGAVKVAKTAGAGIEQWGASLANVVDNISFQVAKFAKEKLGIDPNRVYSPVANKLRKEWSYWGDRWQKEGVQGIAGDLISGTAKAVGDVGSIMALGSWGLPIYGGLQGWAATGTKGAIEGVVTGALLHGILQGVAGLPGVAQVPAAIVVGALTTPGGLKEKTEGAVTFGLLGLIGGAKAGKRMTIDEFLDYYPEVRDKMNERHAQAIIEKVNQNLSPDMKLTPEIVTQNGGALKSLDMAFTEIEKQQEKIKTPPQPKGNIYKFIPKDAPDIWRRVMDVTNGQGIRPHKERGGFAKTEEYLSIPRPLRNAKSTYTMDIVADSLGLGTESDLIKAVQWDRTKARKLYRETGIPPEIQETPPDIMKIRKSLLDATKMPSDKIMEFEMNTFMDGEKVLEISNEVKAGKKTKAAAVAEITQLIKDTTEGLPEIKATKPVVPEPTKTPMSSSVKKPMLDVETETNRIQAKILASQDLTGNEIKFLNDNGIPYEIGPSAPRAEGEQRVSIVSRGQMRAAPEEGSIKIGMTGKPEIMKTFATAYQNIIDRFHAIKKISDLARSDIGELDPFKDPYKLIRTYMGVQGKAETKLFYSRFKMGPKGEIIWKGKSLKEIIQPVNEDIDDFRLYLVNRRVPELEDRGIKTGMDVAEARKFVVANRQRFEPTAREYTEFSHALLDELVDAGYISPEKADIVKSKNNLYAPFQRVMDDLERYGYVPTSTRILSKMTSPLYRIKGSERQIIDPLESTIKATYIITDKAERGRIAQSLLELRKLSPKVAGEIVPIKPRMTTVATLEDGTKVYSPAQNQGQDVIQLMVNGERKYFQVSRDLYQAMSQLDNASLSTFIKWASVPAKILRAGATENPDFPFKNIFKDQWSAFINAKYGYFPGWDFVKGLFTMLNKTETYWKWKASGGEWSMLVSLDRTTNQANLRKLLGFKETKRYLKNPLSFFQDISMLSEMPTRIGVFQHAVGKGVPPTEAAYQSREATTDFAGRGLKMKEVSSLYTFLNARTQGLVRFIKTAEERPGETFVRVFAGCVLPSIINYALNRDNPRYWELPDWQRDIFWMIPIGKRFIRIPKGDIGVIFGTTTEHALRYLDQDKGGNIEVGKLLGKIATETLPISNIGETMPVALRPFIEAVTNKNLFQGRPIVPQQKEELEPAYQYGRFTSETSKAVGKAFNISPAKIDHIITGYGAGMARYALKLSDAVLGEMGIIPKKAPRPTDISEYPVFRAYVTRDPMGLESQSVQKFYDTLEEINRFKATDRRLLKDQDRKEFGKYVESHPVLGAVVTEKSQTKEGEWITLDKEFDRVRDALSLARFFLDAVLESTVIPTSAKKETQERINGAVMNDVITVLNKYEAIRRKVEQR